MSEQTGRDAVIAVIGKAFVAPQMLAFGFDADDARLAAPHIADVLAAAGLLRDEPMRPFQVGDEVHWRWHKDGGSGKWFKARLVEHRPAGYPKGWAGAITDQGTFYAGDDSWNAPIGYVVFLDEPSMTLVTEGGQ